MDMIDIAPYSREQVVLDFEFKLDKQQDLRLKQVRPFLIATAAEPIPEFRLVVPEGLTACGSFVERRPPREILEFKIEVGFRAGTHVLRADGTSTGNLFEWIRLERDGPRDLHGGQLTAGAEHAAVVAEVTELDLETVSGARAGDRGRRATIFVRDVRAGGHRPADRSAS